MGAYALVARNLVQAKKIDLGANGNGKQLVAPCSACFLNLGKAEYYLTEVPELTQKRLISPWALAG
jgi:heterodisulfide reductase subunit B